MFFIKNWLADKSCNPVEVFCGLCIFIVAALGASVQHVASTVLALLFITSLFYVRTWKQTWGHLSNHEHWVLTGFFIYTLSCVLAYYNVEDNVEYVKHAGRYIRFSMIVPVYLLLVKHDVRVNKYLIAGIIFSGPIFLLTAYVDMQAYMDTRGILINGWKPEYGVTGQYYRILFGNIAMLNAIIMTVYLFVEKNTLVMRFAVTASIFCALSASVLSAARSGWVAFILCIPVLLYVLAKKQRCFKMVTITSIVLLLAIGLSPAGQIISERMNVATNEVSRFFNDTVYITSIGTRLALWDVALNVWKKHPIVGTGPGDFDEDFQESQKQGLYRKAEVFSNVHSVYFQSLATTGSIGFIVMFFSLFVFPFRLFLKKMKSGDEFVGLSGMMLVLCFAVFGLTEAWILRAPFMSIYLAYFCALMSSAPKAESLPESDQKAPLNQSAIDGKTLPT